MKMKPRHRIVYFVCCLVTYYCFMKFLFLNGPAYLGLWEGLPNTHICEHMTGVYGFWHTAIDHCNLLIYRKFISFLTVASLLFVIICPIRYMTSFIFRIFHFISFRYLTPILNYRSILTLTSQEKKNNENSRR